MSRYSMMSETLAETFHGQRGRAAKAATPLRRGLAGLTAGALALSVVMASVVPVRAGDNDDLIAALAALALLGVVINEADSKKDDKRIEHYDDRSDHHSHAPYPTYAPPPRLPVIPARCEIEVQGRDHHGIIVYAQRCLDRYDIDHLPRHCAREIRHDGKRDWIYGAACLQDAGYRLQYRTDERRERPD